MPERALGEDCNNQWEEGTWPTNAAPSPQFQWNFIQARVKNPIKQKKTCQCLRAKMALWMTDCAKRVRSKSQSLLEEHPAKRVLIHFFMIKIKMEQVISTCIVSTSFTSSKFSSPQMWKPHKLDQIPVTLLSCRVSQVILTESVVPDWHTDSSPREFCYSKQEEAHVAMAIIHYVKRLKARLQEEQRKARRLSSGKWRLHIAFFHTSNPTSSCFFS